ncbi:MAG: hypothetical protein AAGM22_33645 [Acidobacteriota bacterium]
MTITSLAGFLDLEALEELLRRLRAVGENVDDVIGSAWAVAKTTATKADDKLVGRIISIAENLGVEVEEPPKPESFAVAMRDLWDSIAQADSTGVAEPGSLP